MRSLVLAVGLLALVGSAAAAQSSLPRTLARSDGTSVDALAQDGQFVAWLASGGSACNTVHVLARGKTQLVPNPAAGSMTCHWELSDEQPGMALAARASAVLWTLHQNGSSPVDYVLTASFGGAERRLDRLAHADNGTGLWLGGVAGAGSTLAYSWVDVEYVDPIACLSGGSCRQQIAGGGIRIVVGGRAVPLPGVGPALELAAAGGRLAYVPAAAVGPGGAPAATATAGIEVVNATTGASVCEVQPAGVPLALALSRNVLAVLMRSGPRDRISWYDASDGSPLGSVTVSPRVAPELATSNRVAVYRVGRTLRGIALRTARNHALGRISGSPVGFTLASGILTWAENHASGGRIRALAVG